MQDRYAGDIGDFGKLGMLRFLETSHFTIGVNWYLVPDEEHNGDGKHIAYLADERNRSCDEALWLALKKMVFGGNRCVAELEKIGLLNSIFYSDPLDLSNPDRAKTRKEWHEKALVCLSNADLVFLDPDNGLMVRSAENRRRSNKYVQISEMSDYYKNGSSIVYYQHKARRRDDFYIEQHQCLLESTYFPNATGFGIKFSSTSQRFFFFILQQDHNKYITDRIQEMMHSAWSRHFQWCCSDTSCQRAD